MKGHNKVLFVTDSLQNGGAERQLTLLIKYLPENWQSKLFSLGDGPYAQIIRNLDVDIHIKERTSRFDVRPAIDLWRIILDWQPNIIHCWGWMGLAAVLPICKLFDIPTVGSIRTATTTSKHGFLHQYIVKKTIHASTKVISNSKAGLAAWELQNGKGQVVYNGFEQSRLSSKKPIIEKKNTFTVVMAARMVKAKDYIILLQAAHYLNTFYAEHAWQFVCLGSGPLRNKFIDYAGDLIDRELVIFPPPDLEIIPWLAIADVGVLLTSPDFDEGLSNTIIEYMACGLPVICTDSGGNRELVNDGENGFVLPTNDKKTLSNLLIWMHSHSHEAKNMGMKGQAWVLEHLTVENMVRQTISVYLELIHKKDQH